MGKSLSTVKVEKKDLITKLDEKYDKIKDHFINSVNYNYNINFSRNQVIVLLSHIFINSKLYSNDDFIEAINRIVDKKFDEITLQILEEEYISLRNIQFGLYIDKYRDKLPIVNIKQLIAMLYCYYDNITICKKHSLWNILTFTIRQLNK